MKTKAVEPIPTKEEARAAIKKYGWWNVSLATRKASEQYKLCRKARIVYK